jgi:hypothetical protein
MEEEKSNKMDVSYGVENSQDSVKSTNKKTSKNKKSSNKKNKAKKVEAKVEEKPKKNLIQEIEEMKANGDIKSEEFSLKMEELEKILGVDTINPFGTNELDVFERNLKSMSMADLKNLASKVGVNPFHEKPMLKNILRKEFAASNKNNMKNIMPSPQQSIQLDPNNPQHAKTIEILGNL